MKEIKIKLYELKELKESARDFALTQVENIIIENRDYNFCEDIITFIGEVLELSYNEVLEQLDYNNSVIKNNGCYDADCELYIKNVVAIEKVKKELINALNNNGMQELTAKIENNEIAIELLPTAFNDIIIYANDDYYYSYEEEQEIKSIIDNILKEILSPVRQYINRYFEVTIEELEEEATESNFYFTEDGTLSID